MDRGQPVHRGSLTIGGGGAPVHPDPDQQQARRVPVGRRGLPLIGQVLPCPRGLVPQPCQPSGIPVSCGGFGFGFGGCRPGLGCLVAEVGSAQLVPHGHVALQRGFVPRMRHMVASSRAHIPVTRREITQPGGIVSVLCLMITFIRGLPDWP